MDVVGPGSMVVESGPDTVVERTRRGTKEGTGEILITPGFR